MCQVRAGFQHDFSLFRYVNNIHYSGMNETEVACFKCLPSPPVFEFFQNTQDFPTAKVLFKNFIVHYSFPDRIQCDQGCKFKGEIITQLCAMAAIKISHTTPYYPMPNGMIKQFNRVL